MIINRQAIKMIRRHYDENMKNQIFYTQMIK
jgi:hypothetical protein